MRGITSNSTKQVIGSSCLGMFGQKKLQIKSSREPSGNLGYDQDRGQTSNFPDVFENSRTMKGRPMFGILADTRTFTS